MAKVIVPGGPLGMRGVLAPPQQSRVVAVELHLDGGVGNDDFCVTPPLGNRLWLYKIDMWAYCGTAGAFLGGFFYFMSGTTVPASSTEISTRWDNIIPLSCGQKPGFRWFECDAFHRSFTMAKLFTADGLRFGVVMENGFPQQWEATVAFEISEG